MKPENWRNSTQYLMPAQHHPTQPGDYDIFPCFPLESGKIGIGYAALAQHLAAHQTIVIDGYGGVFWEHLREQLNHELRQLGIEPNWIATREAMKPQTAIDVMVEPFLGGDDPLFGTRFTGELGDFFNTDQLANLSSEGDMTILYGSGAALSGWGNAYLVYVDVPKNEIQYRSRAGSITNLGCSEATHPKAMYKRFYFVDWIALNRHKAEILPQIDLFVDEQRPDEPACITGDALRKGLDMMAHNVFRVRPWFEPGVWGGQWTQRHINGLSDDVPNYAWSFELITPENGLVFESDGQVLEVSFDCLMYHAHEAVLGHSASRFGYDFPIRFNFLDTFEGGNLSVQCHPNPDFAQREFGEPFTQDECYYILDCTPDARVHIGFQESIDPKTFETELRHSFNNNEALDIVQHVNYVQSHTHDLYLIPHETIHGAGIGNLVLEVSATPYIFTFKLYDWVRPDLSGKPRPLNIERGMQNLNFERRGDKVFDELVAKPCVIERGQDWQLVHLPTHADHFYDVYRYEFDSAITLDTGGDQMHIMSLVEGTSILLHTESGVAQRFNYAETFVVPAAAGRYTVTNEGAARARLIQVFVKKSQE